MGIHQQGYPQKMLITPVPFADNALANLTRKLLNVEPVSHKSPPSAEPACRIAADASLPGRYTYPGPTLI